tara:strand:- start:224 stop:1486 length:1263 start_codon:yes stop_codon:yes gene_type:complete
MKVTYFYKIIDAILISLLVLSSGGLLFVFNRNICYAIFLGVLLLAVLFSKDRFKVKEINSVLLTSFTILVLFSINYIFAISTQAINKYAYYLTVYAVSILTLLYFRNTKKKDIFINKLYFILKIILFHAGLNFFAYFFIKNNLSTVSSVNNDYETFLNIFFYVPKKCLISVFGLEFCRNQGVFWEPGILQAFLNSLFFLEAFIIKRSKALLIVIVFVIFTTYSTTGLAILLLQGFVYVYNEFKKNKLLFLLILSALIPIYLILQVNVQDKVQGEKEASFQKRFFDLTQPFYIALENPITGIGLDAEQFQKFREEFYFTSSTLNYIYNQTGVGLKVDVTDKGSSNSIMFLLAATGFPTAFLFIYMFFKQQIIKDKKWLWMIIMLISVMSEPLLLRPYFFIFIVSGFMSVYQRIISHKEQLL